MTIEEKIANFRALLKCAHQAQKKEALHINVQILANNGFDDLELKDVICPNLVWEGTLREQPTFLRAADPHEELVIENNVLKSSFGYVFVINKNKLGAETKAEPKEERLIYKDGSGDYFYNGQGIKIGQDTNHYIVLDIMFNRSDQDGFLSYENIEDELVKRGLKETENTEARNKRINNAANKHQGLFRFAKVNGKALKNRTPDGHELIKIIRGKGLKLSNPQI